MKQKKGPQFYCWPWHTMKNYPIKTDQGMILGNGRTKSYCLMFWWGWSPFVITRFEPRLLSRNFIVNLWTKNLMEIPKKNFKGLQISLCENIIPSNENYIILNLNKVGVHWIYFWNKTCPTPKLHEWIFLHIKATSRTEIPHHQRQDRKRIW